MVRLDRRAASGRRQHPATGRGRRQRDMVIPQGPMRHPRLEAPLRRLYERLGLATQTDELPDYLSLMLELADMLAPAEAREFLGEFRVAIELIHAALADQRSPYLPLFGALSALLGPADAEDLAAVLRLASEGPPAEQVGLDPFAPPEVMPFARAV